MEYISVLFGNLERITCQENSLPCLHEKGLFFRSGRTLNTYYSLPDSIKVSSQPFWGAVERRLKIYRCQDLEAADRVDLIETLLKGEFVDHGFRKGLLVRVGEFGKTDYLPAVLLPYVRTLKETGEKHSSIRRFRTDDLIRTYDRVQKFVRDNRKSLFLRLVG